MIYTVTMNPALDYVIHVDNFKENHTNRTKKEMIFYGGKGINISFVLKQFHIDSCALGFIANFSGEELQRGCQSEGIHTDFIQVEEGITRINVKLKSTYETEINGMGPIITEKHIQKLFEKIDHLNEGDVLILSGSIPKGISDDVYADILSRICHHNILSVVDATNSLLEKTLAYHPFLIKPNIHELESFFHTSITSKEACVPYAQKLQEMGAKNVLVSCGKDGALLIDEYHHIHSIDAINGTLKNSVGAGDSMVAGFLVGYLKHHDYQEALLYGSSAGSATAFQDGLMTYDDFVKAYHQYKGR